MKNLQLEEHRKEHQSRNRMNLKNSILMFSMLFSLCFESCLKDNAQVDHDVVWKGRILENSTNKPIPNADIYLYEHELDNDFLSNSPRILKNIYKADKDGYYEFTYRDLVKNGYEIQVSAGKYYTSNKIASDDRNGVSKVDVLLEPYAWIKFHVKNVNPYDENDNIDINGDCLNKLLIGRLQDTIYICDQIGNKPTDFVWWVEKNNTITKHRDTIPYLKAHDTTYFEIKY